MTAHLRAKYCLVLCSFSLWTRLHTKKKHNISTVAAYMMSTYAETKNIATTPETLLFCCSHQGVECREKNVYTRLSLSPPLEKRAKGEVGGSWPLVGSNHPGCHSQSSGLPYWFNIYPSDAAQVVAMRYTLNAMPTIHPSLSMLSQSERTFRLCFLTLPAAHQRSPATAGPPGNVHAF